MEDPVRLEMTPRRYAQVGVVFGLSVSTWANVARAWPHGWGARLAAAVWPTIVYLAIEVYARTSWGGRVGLWVARGAAVIVGLVAAYLSYQHLAGLLAHYGEPKWSARLGPLGIDGLMALCAAALLNKPADDEATPEPGPAVATYNSTPRELESEPQTPTKVAPPPKPAQRKVNGRDLRVVETVGLIRAARAKGEADPLPNAVAAHFGVTWKTGKSLHGDAMAEVGPR